MKNVFSKMSLVLTLITTISSSLWGANWSSPVDIFTAPLALSPVVGVDNAGNAVILAGAADESSNFFERATQLIQGTPQNSQDFQEIGLNQNSRSISVNASGNAAASWIEYDDNTSTNIVRSALLFGNSWSSPEVISDPVFTAQSFIPPGIALDSSNHAKSVWVAQDTDTFNAHVQENSFNGIWGTPQDVFFNSSFFTSSVMSGSPSGKAIATWIDSTPNALWSSYFDGSVWTTALISTDVYSSCLPLNAVAMNASNNAMLLWNDGSTEGLSSATFINGVYGPQQSVYASGPTEMIDDAAIAIDEAGNAIAIWILFDNGNYSIMTNRWSSGAWGTPTLLDFATGGDSFCYPNIGMDGAGNACAVWVRCDSSANGRVFYNQFSVSTLTWLNVPIQLSAPGDIVDQANLSMNTKGDATVVWVKQNESDLTVQAVYIINAVTPLPAQNLSGKQFTNKFLVQVDRINVLNWVASPDPSVVRYRIYRNGTPIATVLANEPLTYQDHFRKKHERDTYSVTAVSATGLESSPIMITLP